MNNKIVTKQYLVNEAGNNFGEQAGIDEAGQFGDIDNLKCLTYNDISTRSKFFEIDDIFNDTKLIKRSLIKTKNISETALLSNIIPITNIVNVNSVYEFTYDGNEYFNLYRQDNNTIYAITLKLNRELSISSSQTNPNPIFCYEIVEYNGEKDIWINGDVSAETDDTASDICRHAYGSYIDISLGYDNNDLKQFNTSYTNIADKLYNKLSLFEAQTEADGTYTNPLDVYLDVYETNGFFINNEEKYNIYHKELVNSAYMHENSISLSFHNFHDKITFDDNAIINDISLYKPKYAGNSFNIYYYDDSTNADGNTSSKTYYPLLLYLDAISRTKTGFKYDYIIKKYDENFRPLSEDVSLDNNINIEHEHNYNKYVNTKFSIECEFGQIAAFFDKDIIEITDKLNNKFSEMSEFADDGDFIYNYLSNKKYTIENEFIYTYKDALSKIDASVITQVTFKKDGKDESGIIENKNGEVIFPFYSYNVGSGNIPIKLSALEFAVINKDNNMSADIKCLYKFKDENDNWVYKFKVIHTPSIDSEYKNYNNTFNIEQFNINNDCITITHNNDNHDVKLTNNVVSIGGVIITESKCTNYSFAKSDIDINEESMDISILIPSKYYEIINDNIMCDISIKGIKDDRWNNIYDENIYPGFTGNIEIRYGTIDDDASLNRDDTDKQFYELGINNVNISKLSNNGDYPKFKLFNISIDSSVIDTTNDNDLSDYIENINAEI